MTKMSTGALWKTKSMEINGNKWRFDGLVLEPLVDSNERQRECCKSLAKSDTSVLYLLAPTKFQNRSWSQ